MEFHAHDVLVGRPGGRRAAITGASFILNRPPRHGLTLNEDVARAHLAPGSSFFGDTRTPDRSNDHEITDIRCALIGRNPSFAS